MSIQQKRSLAPSVAIYVRVSTLHQVDRDSLPMQKQDLISYARLIIGANDYQVFEDAGYSGKNTDRPQFQEMMSQIRQGRFTHLLVWKIDRISRNLLDFAMMYQELKDLGVTFVSKNEQFDTSSAMGEAMLKIILVFAELERNMTSERVSATMMSRAANGIWNGGRIPYGYDYIGGSFSINEAEAKVVVHMHDSYELVKSLIQVSQILNAEGTLSRSGNEWSPPSVLKILRSRWYCGDYVYNKQKDKSQWVTTSEHHPAIVTREQKERIIAILEANDRLGVNRVAIQRGKYVHLFSGLLTCSNCNKQLLSGIAKPDKQGNQLSYYICPTRRKSAFACQSVSTSDKYVGEFVFSFILNAIKVQNRYKDNLTDEIIEHQLLTGSVFSDLLGIDNKSLDSLRIAFVGGLFSPSTFKPSEKVEAEPPTDNAALDNLRQQRLKTSRAIERLTKLFLFSDDVMSEQEYILQKERLEQTLEELDKQIETADSGTSNNATNKLFVDTASEFIVSQRLTNKNHVSFIRLVNDVDLAVLRSFLLNTLQNITLTNGTISSLTFANGLKVDFILN
jgi:site-specific DNA recombinase